MEPSTSHPYSNLPSDTYDGPLPHNLAVDTTECHRCIADRAVHSALGGK